MSIGPIMFDLDGLTLSSEERDLLTSPLIGGVILFARNFKAPDQMVALTDEIRAIRPDILIAVDQEGGRVQRFKEGFTPLPAMAKVGQLFDKHPEAGFAFSKSCGWLMATEVLAVGVDFSFAPVLDLNKGVSSVIGDRAFHRDPEIVIKLSRAFIAGMREAGMAAIGKHFPGHGSVTADSHLELPVDPRLFDEIWADDLRPFQTLIDELFGLMPAHIFFPHIDSVPVGFSDYWLQEILRQKMGFRGAIFSDDLTMAGAQKLGDIKTRSEFALSAGCDMILICHDRKAVKQLLFSSLQNEVDQNRLFSLKGRGRLDWSAMLQDLHWQAMKKSIMELTA